MAKRAPKAKGKSASILPGFVRLHIVVKDDQRRHIVAPGQPMPQGVVCMQSVLVPENLAHATILALVKVGWEMRPQFASIQRHEADVSHSFPG